MEVVQSNFEEVLDSVREAIENADFIAVDTEFTGVFDVLVLDIWITLYYMNHGPIQ